MGENETGGEVGPVNAAGDLARMRAELARVQERVQEQVRGLERRVQGMARDVEEKVGPEELTGDLPGAPWDECLSGGEAGPPGPAVELPPYQFELVLVDGDDVALDDDEIGVRCGVWDRNGQRIPLDFEAGTSEDPGDVEVVTFEPEDSGTAFVYAELVVGGSPVTAPELYPDGLHVDYSMSRTHYVKAGVTGAAMDHRWNGLRFLGRVEIVDGERTGAAPQQEWWGGDMDDTAEMGDGDGCLKHVSLEGRKTLERLSEATIHRNELQLYGVDEVDVDAVSMPWFDPDGVDAEGKVQGELVWGYADGHWFETSTHGDKVTPFLSSLDVYYNSDVKRWLVELWGFHDVTAGSYWVQGLTPWMQYDNSLGTRTLAWRHVVTLEHDLVLADPYEQGTPGTFDIVTDVAVATGTASEIEVTLDVTERVGTVANGALNVGAAGAATQSTGYCAIQYDNLAAKLKHAKLDPTGTWDNLLGYQDNQDHDYRYWKLGDTFEYCRGQSIGAGSSVGAYAASPANSVLMIDLGEPGALTGYLKRDTGTKTALDWTQGYLYGTNGTDVVAEWLTGELKDGATVLNWLTQTLSGAGGAEDTWTVDADTQLVLSSTEAPATDGATPGATFGALRVAGGIRVADGSYFGDEVRVGGSVVLNEYLYWGQDESVWDWVVERVAAGSGAPAKLRFKTGATAYALTVNADVGVDAPGAAGYYAVDGVKVVKAQGAHIADAATDLNPTNDVTGSDTVDQGDLEGILDAIATRVNVLAGKINSILAVLDTTHGLVASS